MTPVALFRSLADETRLRLLALIAGNGELCVCELTAALGVVQPKVSRHLASLREAGVVADRRDGQWVHYRLHPDLPPWARKVIREAAGAVKLPKQRCGIRRGPAQRRAPAARVPA